MFRNIIFDWSGTLCDDLALTLEATNYVLAQYGRPTLSRTAFRDEFQLPYPDYYAVKIPEARLEELENHYRHAFDASALLVQILPHVREFMEFCTHRGIRCFVLTSMDPVAFDTQAEELGMKPYFEHIHSGIHNKEDYIPRVMLQHGLLPGQTAFIGDMQHDIRAAHRAGVTGIGVLTGYNNAQQLSQAEPELIVPHLGALRQLMQRMPRHESDTLSIHHLEFSCHVGVPEEERAKPQTISADIRLVPPFPFSAMEENLSRTVDWEALSHRLIACAREEPTRLLETLAHKLASCCVQEFGALSAQVELRKFILPHAAHTAVQTCVRADEVR